MDNSVLNINFHAQKLYCDYSRVDKGKENKIDCRQRLMTSLRFSCATRFVCHVLARRRMKWFRADQRHLNLDEMHSEPVNLRRNKPIRAACDFKLMHLVHSSENKERINNNNNNKKTISSLSSAWIIVMWLACDSNARSLQQKSVDFSSTNWTEKRKTKFYIFIVSSHARLFLFLVEFCRRWVMSVFAVLVCCTPVAVACWRFGKRWKCASAMRNCRTHTHSNTLCVISTRFSKSSARYTCVKMIQFHLTTQTNRFEVNRTS